MLILFYANNFCKYRETHDFYIFSGLCVITKKPYSVKVPKEALYKYNQGALIQEAMPTVSKDDREFLISGYSPEGWKQVFGEES